METLQEENKKLAVGQEHEKNLLEQSKSARDEAAARYQDTLHKLEKLQDKLDAVVEKNVSLNGCVKSLEAQVETLADQTKREAEAYEHTLERQNVKNN